MKQYLNDVFACAKGLVRRDEFKKTSRTAKLESATCIHIYVLLLKALRYVEKLFKIGFGDKLVVKECSQCCILFPNY